MAVCLPSLISCLKFLSWIEPYNHLVTLNMQIPQQPKFINNFFQCRYILILEGDDLITSDTFNRLKHVSIIIGGWNIHWGGLLLFEQLHMLVDTSPCSNVAFRRLAEMEKAVLKHEGSTNISIILFTGFVWCLPNCGLLKFQIHTYSPSVSLPLGWNSKSQFRFK